MNETNHIKNKAISGFFWSLFENGGSYFLHFIIGLILVRLIPPVDYGIIGMMTIFFVMGNVLADSGLSTAIIQKRNPLDEDYSTVLIVNIAISILFYLLIFITAPLIAEFYDEPVITFAIRIFGLNALVAGFGIVQQAIISRNLNYKLWARINLTSLLLAGITAIIMAYYGMGLWALVYIQLIQNAANTVQLWIFGKWGHGWKFSLESFKSLFKFSNPLLVINTVNAVYMEIYYMLIGRIFRAEKLAYYMRARQTAEIFPLQFTYTLNKVMLPVFSNLQDEIESLKSALKKVFLMVGFLNFSILAFLSANGEALFVLLFTERWLDAVPLFAVLTIEGMFMPAFTSIGNILIARDKSKLYMKIELAKKVFQTVVIIFTLSSLQLIVIGQFFVSLVFMLVGFLIAKKEINYSFSEQVKIFIPYLGLAGFIYLINYFSNILMSDFNYAVQLLANTAISIVLFLSAGHFLKFEAFIIIKSIVLEKLALRRKLD
ncbi:MAG: lipopolysaccharide biosynthesis protein [Candidatus Kapabacteria bacterium]|nr:lipopolysaccharide biosynthesis protein [Ignavibacteriota bacterium]MCW5884798.1 lipopolysaccharide biosynthesis protein [Candidatus Kapabacteria bacterium]